jgi:mannosyltransferase
LQGKGLQVLLGLTALAAAFRFATLGVQSYWLDEAVTVSLVELDLGEMLRRIPDSESTPPLYYLLAFGWSKLFGTGEVGLRSLSALLGTATVPAAYAAGRALVSDRVGLAAAALVSVNPFLIWYSQEARSYALLVLLAALSFLFFVRALRDWSRSALAWWGLASALALLAHYFAVFLVAPEAAWLLLSSRAWDSPRTRKARGEALAAVAAVAVVGAALLPLALDQRSNASFIGESSLASRIAQVPKQYLVGFDGPVESVCIVVAAALAATSLGLLGRRGDPEEREGAGIAALIGGAAIALPLALAVVGVDYLQGRNLIAALVPLLLVLAAGFGARRAGRAGAVTATALCLLSLGISASIPLERRFQRDDWRGVAEAMGSPDARRGIVVSPGAGTRPLELYLNGSRIMPPRGSPITDLVLVSLRGSGERRQRAPRRQTPLPPEFREASRRETDTFTLVRFRADVPVTYSGDRLAALLAGETPTSVLLETPERR